MPSEDLEIRLNTKGEQSFRRLSRDFGEAARGGLQTKLRENIRRTADPVLNDIRARCLAVEVSSSRGGNARPNYSRGLRRRVAAAVRVTVAYRGVRFGVQGSSVGPYGAALAAYLNFETAPNWRHPVFGHRVWEAQRGQPFFFVTINHHADDFEDACWRAIDEVLRRLG
jgi:hypothetical protein